VSLLLALLLQVGPNPAADPMAARNDELLRRGPRRNRNPVVEIEQINPASAWLQQCLNQVESDPARAHSMAQIRRTETSGAERVLADLCLGVAASELGRWSDAEAAFMAAREGTPQGEARTRARFAAMAGNAALEGGDPATAIELLTHAKADAERAAFAPLQAIAAIDTARALVALQRGEEALAALDSAISFEPRRSESWLLKATLLRRLDRLEEAQSAIEQAAILAPKDQEVALEAGVIAVLDGRDAAARASWESAIALDPDSIAAETARGYLAQLEPVPAPTITDIQL
jgi:tetratricopeptide (TPR) repeat protein